MRTKENIVRAKIHHLDYPTECQKSLAMPYVVMHNPNARGNMYLLMAGKSPSHTNLIEDLGHDANDPHIVGGGFIRLAKSDGDAWQMSIEAGSHYDSVPINVQSRFAEKVRRALSKQGLKITDVQNVIPNNTLENHHWDSYHQMA